MDNPANTNGIALTLDVDWAPDFMIDFAAQILSEHRVRSTWFVTHGSPALERLRSQPDLFELGIHPNFFPGSTHGDSPGAVLRHCLNLVPEAVSLRTHGLLQSTALLGQIMNETGITTDASLYLPHANGVRPLDYQWEKKSILRVPHFWEDDFEMERAGPCWSLAPLLAENDGLKVFDFHPIHIYLNSSTTDAYRQLKQKAAKLSEVSEDQAAAVAETGTGTQTLFRELVNYLSETRDSLRMRDIQSLWRQGHFQTERRV
jgi:hypothetical protein